MAISSKPEIMGGIPCVDGTRIPVRAIKEFQRAGYSVHGIMKEYPGLTAEQIAEAIHHYGHQLTKTD